MGIPFVGKYGEPLRGVTYRFYAHDMDNLLPSTMQRARYEGWDPDARKQVFQPYSIFAAYAQVEITFYEYLACFSVFSNENHHVRATWIADFDTAAIGVRQIDVAYCDNCKDVLEGSGWIGNCRRIPYIP
jgi:hypothetical protein